MSTPTTPSYPPIKFDLQTRFGTIYDEKEQKAIAEVLARDAPTSDKKVVEFEQKFAEFCGTKFAVSVSNGTAALMMAFRALNIGPGDEVITTPITWIATAAAAVVLGASIKFGDVDPNTLNLDPVSVEKLITPKTKAICPVHLYGLPVDMDAFLEIGNRYNIPIIEDAAHAPGGKYHGKMTGNLGQIGCFSFHEQKNMSTLGEGGMITTNDPVLYEKMRGYKSHCARVIGGNSKYLALEPAIAEHAVQNHQFWYQDFDDCGYNFRMNDITGAVGLCQLEKLPQLNEKRRTIAKRFITELGKMPEISIPIPSQDVSHTYHLFPIFIDAKISPVTRDEFIHHLRLDYGIKCGVHYMPLVQTGAFLSRGYNSSLTPIACEQWPKLVTLPIHPRMMSEHVDYLINSIKNMLKR
jgi:dTDP-4-amino-4,6-dideoxygalactose transaminase